MSEGVDKGTGEIKTKKNRNTKEYIRNYMRERYHKDPKATKKYQRTCTVRREYDINPDIHKEFGNDTYIIVRLWNQIKELEDGNFDKFLKLYPELSFNKKANTQSILN